ncbi:uncharacterized protein Nmlp_3335 [Natronomonas moolapensis 8.8.11]|uniref:Uncharacterized protein n=1 Tax=Natronomonas moolapensis (strain DSM 18674 / CECT 7526 / JCM 14361 / 8.8.11) TaxID=268739 RepID=M1XLC4_NATM8|nr:hypothetical protein [Natronomonas moolapensis]CCQ37465.1 uncharacterized protein Nmlp_3335 [Natronomonas moolapensis 8.8.11]
MGAVSKPLVEEARSVFHELGYELTAEGEELRAERKWRTVYVTTVDPAEANTHGRLRCFVARAERAPEIQDRLLAMEPGYDWAVISIDEEGEYRVLHPSADVLPAP